MKEWDEYKNSLFGFFQHFDLLKIRANDIAEFYQSLHDLDVSQFDKFDVSASSYAHKQALIAMENYRVALIEFGNRNPGMMPGDHNPEKYQFSLRYVIGLFAKGEESADKTLESFFMSNLSKMFPRGDMWWTVFDFQGPEENPSKTGTAYHVFNVIPALFAVVTGYRSNHSPTRTLLGSISKMPIPAAQVLVNNYGPFYDNVARFDLGLGYAENKLKTRSKFHASYYAANPDHDYFDASYVEAAILEIPLEHLQKFVTFKNNNPFVETSIMLEWVKKGFDDFEYVAQWVDEGFGYTEAAEWYERGVHCPSDARKMKSLSPAEWTSSW